MLGRCSCELERIFAGGGGTRVRGANAHMTQLSWRCFSHTEALKFFKNQLSPYEQSEILGYSELWFLGLEAKKLNVIPEKSSKISFDDEHGSYMKVLGD